VTDRARRSCAGRAVVLALGCATVPPPPEPGTRSELVCDHEIRIAPEAGFVFGSGGRLAGTAAFGAFTPDLEWTCHEISIPTLPELPPLEPRADPAPGGGIVIEAQP
jgi:hypothetical protein